MKFSLGENAQNEDASNVYLSDGSMSSDMVTDGDDLLTQLSCDLGLSDLMDQDDNSILTDSSYERDSGLFYDRLFSTDQPDENEIFNEIFSEGMRSDSTSSDSSFELKIDSSQSRVSNLSSFPPSPSGSESSNTSSEVVSINCNTTLTNANANDVSPLLNSATPPVSPLSVTVCPNSSTFSNVSLSPTHVAISPTHTTSFGPTIVTSPNIIKIVTLPPQNAITVQTSQLATTTMNVKVPIPKITKPAPTPVKPTPLILTSQQIAQLTQNGMIKMSTSVTSSANVVSTPANILTPSPIVIKTEPNQLTQNVQRFVHVNSSFNDSEMKSLKRQQRMIKNRESACLSRRKKKEYVTNLEDQINLLSKENSALKQENEKLKSRLSELESEKKLLSDGILNNGHVRKGTALFALLFVLTVNLGPLSGIYSNSPADIPLRKSGLGAVTNSNPIAEPHHFGRSLLWAETEPASNISTNSSSNPGTMCPMYFNQTESRRLDNQLRGWFKLDPTVANVSTVSDFSAEKFRPKRRKMTRKSARPINAIDHYVRPETHKTGSIYHMLISDRNARNSKFSKYDVVKSELTLFETSTERFTLESFFEAINRREDTFYVVSFSGDHLLLPATSRNESARPRMSLFLPSINVPVNDSMQPPANHIAMMQIDCEVINTSLVHISEEAIPTHLNARMKSDTGFGGSEAPKPNANSTLERNESTNSFGPKNLFRNFEKSNNLTRRVKRGHLDDDTAAMSHHYINEHFDQTNRTWSGPLNKTKGPMLRRNKQEKPRNFPEN